MANVVLTVRCVHCKQPKQIKVTREQYEELSKPRSERKLIQDILPDHEPGEREMLISGICDECWNRIFGN